MNVTPINNLRIDSRRIFIKRLHNRPHNALQMAYGMRPRRRPWSLETVASSIDGTPLDAKPISAVGEIVDLSCYLQVGKHGDKHRDCGQKCVANGQPVGLLTADGSIYMLIDEEHNARRDGLTEFRKQAIEHMAHIVTVHGTLSVVAGQQAIYVQGYLKK